MSTQHIINLMAPATTNDIVTLEEMKTWLRIPPTDTAKDEALALMISSASAQIATMINRNHHAFNTGLGKAKYNETFYNITPQERLYFSRWPVAYSDIVVMTLNGTDILLDSGWKLEEYTGTLYQVPTGRWSGTLDVEYNAGYDLPTQAPHDLKIAAFMGVRESYYEYIRGASLSGVRAISHKAARVQYMQPTFNQGVGGSGAGLSPTWMAINNMLSHYFRPWV